MSSCRLENRGLRILNSSSVQMLISVSSIILCNTGAWEVIEVVVRAGYRDFYAYFMKTNTRFLSITGYTSCVRLCVCDEKGLDRATGLNIYLCVLSCVCVCLCAARVSRHACLFVLNANELEYTHVAYYLATVVLNINSHLVK